MINAQEIIPSKIGRGVTTRSDSFDYNSPIFGPVFRRILEKIVSLAKKYAAGRNLLEVGCGEGFVMRCLAKEGFSITGIDIDEKKIKKLREEEKQNAFVSDLRDFQTGEYDMILFCDSLKYMHDPDEVIEKALTMAPRVLISETNPLVHFVGRMITLRSFKYSNHISRFSLRKFKVSYQHYGMVENYWILTSE